MKKLRVGVIGVGTISDMHIKSYLNNKNVELVALCDINKERLIEKAQKYNVIKTFTDYNKMLTMDELDAVSICTWNNVHAPIAIAAIKAGKHVLNEKPLCISVEEALEVEKAAKNSNKVFQVGFVRRYASNSKVIEEYIKNGDVGDIYYAKASCIRRIGNPGGWFSDLNRSGGGPLIDLGVHIIDIMWYMMGKPEVKSVSGNVYNKLGNMSNIKDKSFYKTADYSADNNSVEDMANALIRFSNGASMFVDVSYSLHTEKDVVSIELHGTKAGVSIEPACKIYTVKFNRLVDIIPNVDNPSFNFEQSFQNEIDSFVDCCLNGKQTLSPIEDGVTLMKILNAVYYSSKCGQEIVF